MAKAAFWRSDWFLGGLLTLFVLLAGAGGLLQGFERKAYDLGMQAASRVPSERIAIIAIDAPSLASLGRWPWSRDLYARLIDRLASAPAKVIASTVFFSEAQLDPGYRYISRLIDIVNQSAADGVVQTPETARIAAVLGEAETTLNGDRQLAASLARAGNVILPFGFEAGEAPARPDGALPAFLLNSRLPQVAAANGEAVSAARLQLPIDMLGGTARALGLLSGRPDGDGVLRSEPLVVRYADHFYPALSLMVAARSLDLGPADLQVTPGREVRLGKLRISTNRRSEMHPYFYKETGSRPAFAVDSFADVLSGKIPASKYAGKIVLIGATVAGLEAAQATPISSAMPPVLTLAHALSSILQEQSFVTPAWGGWLSLGITLLVGLYLMFVLPRLTVGIGALLSLLLLLALVGSHFGLMLGGGLWLPLTGACSLLLLGQLALSTRRLLPAERGKESSGLPSADANRMLGLAFQGQGLLDLAFDKFRHCPLDESLLENLYSLALDYEGKRQFAKAEAVLRYMADFNPRFRDLPERLERLEALSATRPVGNQPGDKPMLGRYRLEKELGKGAMGVVYLGRDPKMNRVVAIKTMELAQEFDAEELAEVKQRFFREAETAGRLNHPNIVTMYDAGEEHDLAYIAMEFLKGRDLVPQTKPGALLPLPVVLSIIARVAEALDYAHRNNVVHRDIKPANIMYEPASDQVKVTDFGIARITDASKTRTGMVLGTPSYMSPEQLAGKKIDGRSDLFSLGVTLYQMCCGQLPFTGESLAQLMYKIANEAPVDIAALNSQLPAAVLAVIERALQKNVAQRYQQGGQMAADLRACLAELAASEAGQ